MSSLKRIHVYGHVSAQPQAIANLFGAQVTGEVIADSDLAIFAINPAAGIDQNTIDQWQALSDYQLPRLVVVNELDGSDADFATINLNNNSGSNYTYTVASGWTTAATKSNSTDLERCCFSADPRELCT